MFGRKIKVGLSEYSLDDIPALVDKTGRYRDLIRVYQGYVSALENKGIDSPQARIARLGLRDKLLFVNSKEVRHNNGYGFFEGELRDIAYNETRRILKLKD